MGDNGWDKSNPKSVCTLWFVFVSQIDELGFLWEGWKLVWKINFVKEASGPSVFLPL